MSDQSKTALVLFTTTKGHFGHKEIYKTTVLNLENKIGGLDYFPLKLAHIKESESDSAAEMKLWLESKGFEVLVTKGRWSHGDLSHQQEYLRDIHKTFNHRILQTFPHALWLEDDFVFVEKSARLADSLSVAREVLKFDHNVLGFRFLREGDNDIKQRTSAKPYGENLFSQRVEFSFNPTVVRPRDVFINMSLLAKNIHYLSRHCELAYTQIAQMITESDAPFVCLEPDQAFVRHVGTKEFDPSLCH